MSSSATAPVAEPAGLTPRLGVQVAPRTGRAASGPGNDQGIAVDDWDLMFDAVRVRLMHSVGERLGELPEVPQHSAELSASLVQAVVLDCVRALERLHAALEQERSQRPTS